MRLYQLLLGALAVWRLTHLFAAEDGPFQLIVRLRRRTGTEFWATLLDCFYCLSLWISVPFAVIIGNQWSERILLWPALSTAAIFLEHAMNRLGRQSAVYWEDPPEEEEHDELLRKS